MRGGAATHGIETAGLEFVRRGTRPEARSRIPRLPVWAARTGTGSARVIGAGSP
jgi:hypothetical protein